MRTSFVNKNNYWETNQAKVRKSAFPGGASSKEPIYHCRRCKRHEFDPWARKILWRKAWQPTPIFLPGESHGQRSLAGYSPWGCKESDITEAFRTHFTFLALPFPVLFMKKCSPPVWSGTEDSSIHARGIHARNGMLESLWVRGYSKGK